MIVDEAIRGISEYGASSQGGYQKGYRVTDDELL